MGERCPDGDVSRADRSGRSVVYELSERPLGIAFGASDRSAPWLPLAAERITSDADDEFPDAGLSFAHVTVPIVSVRARSRAIVG